jgi:hypothetical protein
MPHFTVQHGRVGDAVKQLAGLFTSLKKLEDDARNRSFAAAALTIK